MSIWRTRSRPRPRRRRGLDAVEWGIAAINADDVWAQFGNRGEGAASSPTSTRGSSATTRRCARPYRGSAGRRGRPQLQLVRPGPPLRRRRRGALRQQRPRHPHDGHDGRRRRGQPGRRRAGRPLDRGQGLRDQHAAPTASLLASGQWTLAPTDTTGANPRPDLRPEHRQQLVGRGQRLGRATPGTTRSSQAGPRPACSVSSPTATPDPAATRPARRPTRPALLRRRRLHSRTAAISTLEPRPRRERRDPAEHHRAGQWPSARRSPATRTPVVQRHLDGRPARGRLGGAAVVARAGAGRRHRRHPSAARQHRGRRLRPHLRGTADRQQRLGRGQARRAGGRAPGTGRRHRHAGRHGDRRRDRRPGGRRHRHRRPAPSTAPSPPAPTARTAALLPVGDYDVSVTAFGYDEATATATVLDRRHHDGRLRARRRGPLPVTGIVSDPRGAPVAGAIVTIERTPLRPATTGSDGVFTFADVPGGQYTRHGDAVGGCATDAGARSLIVDGNEIVAITLPTRPTPTGTRATRPPAPGPAGHGTKLALTGDDASQDDPAPVPGDVLRPGVRQRVRQHERPPELPGRGHRVQQRATSRRTAAPNAAVYPFWDDLNIDASAGVYTGTATVGGRQAFVVEWRNAPIFGATDLRIDAEAHAVRERRGAAPLPWHRPGATRGSGAARRRSASRTRPARSRRSSPSTRLRCRRWAVGRVRPAAERIRLRHGHRRQRRRSRSPAPPSPSTDPGRAGRQDASPPRPTAEYAAQLWRRARTR